MRKPKANGNHRPHGAECSICAKPKFHKERQLSKEILKAELDMAEEEFYYVCGCGRIDCYEYEER